MTTRVHVEEVFGREVELARLRGAVASDHQLVTLLGPAGVGKSALAAAIAKERPRGEGAIVVDASGPLDARELVRRVSQAAAVPARSARAGGDALSRLAAVLDDNVPLVNIDDVEQVSAVNEVVSGLLERGQRSSFVVTSRAALGVRGEVIVDVAPLSVDAGVALFLSRVGDALEKEASLHTVRALVDRLDGLPLAIVLAAGRTSVLSVEAILSRLDEPLAVLRGGTTGVSARHATLEQAIETSYAALSPDDRAAFACASFFEGTFSADAFEGLATEAVQCDALDALESLLRKSFLERSRSPGAVRFRLLHVVRAFARKHARDAKSEDALASRYEAYVELAASRLARETYGAGAERALVELELLLPDVLSAFASALESRPARAAALWVSLFDVVLFRDAVRLDDARFAAAIVAADRAALPPLRVRARILRARASLELGPPDGAAPDLREALAIAVASSDAALVAEARRSLGWMELASGKPEDALRELEAALAASVTLRDTRGHADALAAMGLAEHLLGRPERGRESLVLARALHAQQKDELRRRRVDDMLRLVTPATSAAGSEHEQNVELPEDAERVLLDAASRHEARGQSFRVAFDMALLADLEDARGDAAAASEHRVRARAAARAAGLQPLEEAIARAPSAPPRPASSGWVLGDDARTLRTPEGTSIDLVRHGSLRKVLEALVVARIEHPGVALSASEVLEAGWPGERVLHDAGLLRVYSAVRRLRRMGLEAALVTRDDGYLIDATVPMTREGKSPPRA